MKHKLRLRAWLTVVVVAAVLALFSPVFAAIPDIPPAVKHIIGLYERDGNRFLLRENDGRMEMVYDLGDKNGSFFFVYAVYPLQALGGDEYRLDLTSPLGTISGKVNIERDAAGFGTVCRVGEAVYNRRFFDPEIGKTYRLESQYSMDELRQRATAASPPRGQSAFPAPELVNVASLDATIQLDIRYATDNNFIGAPLYDRPRAFLRRPAAEALVRVHKKLALHGYGLIIHDAYRPWSVTKMFWDAAPDSQKIFVADPAKGSCHNRGGAVDVSLYVLATGQPVEMLSDYDEFSLRAHSVYPGGTAHQRRLRDALRIYMESEGFGVYEEEWWHFDYKDWRKYPVMNSSFAELDAAGSR